MKKINIDLYEALFIGIFMLIMVCVIAWVTMRHLEVIAKLCMYLCQ